SLTTVDLTGNGQGDCAVIGIAIGIRNNKVNLTTVNLRCNRLGDEGTEILCQALQLNCSIVTLDLRSNEITENGAELLAKILRR
ncbi:unnamed protein product, partial [Rotaria magnacalcarata]